MKEEYDALMKNGRCSLVPCASKTNVVDGNNKGTVDNIISQLGFAFALKRSGHLILLGTEIVPHVSGILLSQKKYILELLQSDDLSNCKPVYVSIFMLRLRIIGLQLNGFYVIFMVRFQHGIAHTSFFCFTLQAFTDVLWKGNPDTSLEAFSDADWAGNSDDRRSTRGIFYISWFKPYILDRL
ncbi:retrovirus-related pol polyprotein from transposon TNT 1-94 [Tanacetum coccineum]|uniref:Retrovirus-related pol polyprotein from transposon TNT 1-94 n=1 Tax=Tanacetum coccineum TaxID=301880 RepID=A0ABQ5ETW6_9ASTR